MITTTVDLGQLIVAGLIAVVGFFIRRELANFTKRIDRHDQLLDGLIKDVATLIGIVGMRRGEYHLHQARRPDDDGGAP